MAHIYASSACSKGTSNLGWSAPLLLAYKSKEEGKDQESIQSSATPDPGHHMGVTKSQENITYKRVKKSVLGT